jgi:hypothetical protein
LGLECFQRSGFEPVPGCRGSGRQGVSYCYAPSSNGNLLVSQGNNGRPFTAFPLFRCSGDCDSDDECAGSLRCFMRSGYEPVPGCGGSGEMGTDYCYDPNDGPSVDPGRGFGGFALKMFWQPGYYWQEESFERQWCMECGGGSCDYDDKLYIKQCSATSTRFETLSNEGNGVQIQIRGTDLCLERTGGPYVRTRTCDSSTWRQRWIRNLDSSRFEIHPVGEDWNCLTTDHQPKANEEVFVQDCWTAAESNSEYWNKF